MSCRKPDNSSTAWAGFVRGQIRRTQMMQDFQSDFDRMPFEPGFEMNTFDDFGGGWDF